MRFQRTWLRRVLSVPYVPTLGPVHPDTLTPELFDVVVVASQTGQVLPFDKDGRWSQRKDQAVLVHEVIHQPDRTIIPTISRRAGGMVKTYYYGSTPPNRAALLAATRQWCASYGAHAGRAIWFDPATPADAATSCTRLLLKVFGTDRQPHEPTPGLVRPLHTCPRLVRATFTDFAQHLHTTGFGFLHRRWQAGQVDGPILVAVAEQRIVGAIGPLRTMPDQRGHSVLLPQYFGVLPEHRGRGHGRALWHAATAWAEHHRAAYQLLQTENGHVSDRLFLSEGLTCLGYAHSVTT
ncbi:MAG: GNAT family N-acetyltransferase [Sciscionella sp.]